MLVLDALHWQPACMHGSKRANYHPHIDQSTHEHRGFAMEPMPVSSCCGTDPTFKRFHCHHCGQDMSKTTFLIPAKRLYYDRRSKRWSSGRLVGPAIDDDFVLSEDEEQYGGTEQNTDPINMVEHSNSEGNST